MPVLRRSYVYWERGDSMLHLWINRRLRTWGYALRLRGRFVLFGGRRNAR